MKSKKVLPLILLLFVAIMILSVGMIAKEYRERQQDAKSKCFVFSKDGYEEITYSELCLRKDTDIRYQEKKFVPLHEMLMEVTPEQYADFYRTKNRQRYLDRRSAENRDISIDMLTTDDPQQREIYR